MTHSIHTLDCTFRDGGNLNNWKFTDQDIDCVASHLDKSGVDYIEIGYRGGSGSNKAQDVGGAARCDNRFLKGLPRLTRAAYSVMVVPRSCELSNALSLRDFAIGLVRVASYPEHLQEALDYARALIVEGFRVSLNLMSVSYVAQQDLADISKRVEEAGADLFYIADSYGALRPHAVFDFINTIRSSTSIEVGFHGHNNLGLALPNALSAIEGGASHIDLSLCGMARGAGNLATELFMAYGTDTASPELLHALSASEYVRSHLLPAPMPLTQKEIRCGLHNVHYYYYERIKKVCDQQGLDIDEVMQRVGRMRPSGVEGACVDSAVSAILANRPPITERLADGC